jgi:hypothetical protein
VGSSLVTITRLLSNYKKKHFPDDRRNLRLHRVALVEGAFLLKLF